MLNSASELNRRRIPECVWLRGRSSGSISPGRGGGEAGLVSEVPDTGSWSTERVWGRALEGGEEEGGREGGEGRKNREGVVKGG